MMRSMRSVSEPSLGTVGASTITTNATSRASSMPLQGNKGRANWHRGKFLWEGKFARVTLAIVMLPWQLWWQTLLLTTIIYKYVVHLLLVYYLDKSWEILDLTLVISELVFLTDLMVNCLHAFWPLVRLHIRVYRRTLVFLAYDAISLVPLTLLFRNYEEFKYLVLLGRWLEIGRIYRLITYFNEINSAMRKSRRILFVMEHTILVCLILHAATCFWYALHRPEPVPKLWYSLGFPGHVAAGQFKFDGYTQCWYYCSCRFFNVMFGDSFPLRDFEKWLSAALMLSGYVFFRYRFIGHLTWELLLESERWSDFVDRYHHMLNHLRFCGAPPWLVEQARDFKLQLWRMKDGILRSQHLQDLPHPLQMELIFDINVGHFHNSLLFKDTGEAFMRQISLLMRHELYLAGQQIWSQGVVKSGMICVKRGVVELLSDEDDESPMIAFKEGTVLGETSLFYSKPSKVTVKAATYVELQVLHRTDFMRALSENPHLLKQIRGNVEHRILSARRRQEAIEEYDKGDARLIRTRYRAIKVLKDHLAGLEDEDPTFVDDSHMYYKDENQVRQPKFTPEYLPLYQLSSNVTTVDAPRVCLNANFPWILEPDTDFVRMFDIAHFFMVLYACIVCPQHAITASATDLEQVLDIILLAGLIFNLYIQLTTAIVGKNIRKETIREIAEVKMATVGFYLDVLSVFPIYIFSETLDPNAESVWGEIAKLFPIVQVWHLWDYIGKWEKSFDSHVKMLCLFKHCLLLCIFCYWSGCFLYLYACPKKLCTESSWMAQLMFWETKVFVTNDAKHERPMLSALAFGTAVFTGSGLTDISPGMGDLIAVVCIFAIGSYMSIFYIASVSSIYVLSTQRRLRFKESMRELFYFLTVNRVSGKIKARVKKFFCVQWYYNNAVSTEELFRDMSSNIQQEVLAIEMVDTLQYCPLFQECSRDFLQTVAGNTRTIVLPDNEIVQHAADIGRDMYIIQKGHCKMLNHQGKTVMTLGPGSHFGVVEMLFGLPKVHTVLTVTNCILRHVEYSALVQCWSAFPDTSDPVTTALQSPELIEIASSYEEAKPLTGRMDVKINRIAQEIKESFVVLSRPEQKRDYYKAFDSLGIMRYIKYIFLPGCITPHGLFLKLWCTLRFTMAVYYIIFIPYSIATKQYKHGSTYNWPDVVLYVDVVVMAYVSYYDERLLLVTHPLLTVSRYLRYTFLWDIISIFPFEQLFYVVNEHTDMDLCRINRLLLVTRITGACAFWEGDIMRVSPAVVLLKFLPLAATLVNLGTAFFFINSCVTHLPPGSPLLLVNCTRALVVASSKVYETNYAAREYIHTLFWVFEIFVGTGCTPTTAAGSADVVMVMALQMTGFLYFAFMFGYVASTRTAASHSLLEHTENTKDLENFLYQENVEPVLTAKTLKYFEYVWKRTNGSNPQKICRGLNSALMEDTLVFMYERALREVPLFGKVERSFIRVVTQHLHEMYFLKGETVIQCRDVQHFIYIIYRGKVDVMNSYSEMITCMGPGGMFGNFTGQPISCSEVSIYASRSLDLLVIPSQTFFSLVKYYPKIQEPLHKAFQVSRDYILPITMNFADDSSSESEGDLLSLESEVDSRGSSRYDLQGAGQLSMRSSHSNVSQAKSSASVATYQSSYMHASNLVRPGSYLFQSRHQIPPHCATTLTPLKIVLQFEYLGHWVTASLSDDMDLERERRPLAGFGYVTSIMATLNYVLVLYNLVTLNDCFVLFWLQAIFDLFFYIKIYLAMHQGYINKHGELVTRGARCRTRYNKHRLWVWSDVLANLPLEPLGLCFSPVSSMHYLRVNKLFRLKYLFEFYRRTAAELTHNLTKLQLVTSILVMVLLIHSCTCVWLLALAATSPVSIIRTLKLHQIDSETPQHRWDYVTSFYVVVAEVTTTGGDEFVLDGVVQMLILALSLVSGKILAGIVVATSIQVAYSTKYALTSYERKTGELIDMLKNQGLSSYQSNKFWKYVTQLWITERGRQLPVLLAQTPYVRRCDLMSAMFGHHLRNCFLFADTGEPFLRQLTVALDYTVFFPGNYIVVSGDSEARMHWVASGSVSVVSVRADLTETAHELLGAGDVFGVLQGLYRGITHCFSYRAETKVSVLTLSLDSWVNILPYFPEAKKTIDDRAQMLFAEI